MTTLYDRLQTRGRELTEAIRQAYDRGDTKAVDALTSEKNELNKLMHKAQKDDDAAARIRRYSPDAA